MGWLRRLFNATLSRKRRFDVPETASRHQGELPNLPDLPRLRLTLTARCRPGYEPIMTRILLLILALTLSGCAIFDEYDHDMVWVENWAAAPSTCGCPAPRPTPVNTPVSAYSPSGGVVPASASRPQSREPELLSR
jgi:hypothetical protein